MSRPPQARRSWCLDIICVFCYKTGIVLKYFSRNTDCRIKMTACTIFGDLALKGIYQIMQHYFLRPAPDAVHFLEPT